MSSAITRPTSISAANVVGGVGAPRARLLGRLNQCTTPTFEVGVGDWKAQGAGGSIQTVFDPTNIFGRYTLEITDAGAGQESGAYILVDNKAALTGLWQCITMWIKAVDADTDAEIIAGEVGGAADTITSSEFALTANTWTFVSIVGQWDTATAETFNLSVFPAADGPGDLGTVRITAPRFHRVFETLTSIPIYPYVDWRFAPHLKVKPKRNTYGQLEVSKRGWIPRFEVNYPLIDVASQMPDLGAILQHDGPILFEPTQDTSFTFLVSSSDAEWNFPWAAGRAVGHTGGISLDGVDPVFSVPVANIYYEQEDGYYVAIPNYVHA